MRIVLWRDMLAVGTAVNILATFVALIAASQGFPAWAAAAIHFSPLPAPRALGQPPLLVHDLALGKGAGRDAVDRRRDEAVDVGVVGSACEGFSRGEGVSATPWAGRRSTA
jgi:hypothetical protein